MYEIIFEDGQVWQGGNYNDSKWNEMPNKLIKKIVYTIGNKRITLEGYEAYNHIVERVQFVLNANKPKITKAILMGLSDGRVFRMICNVENNIVTSDVVDYGKEYYEKAVTGWKIGERIDYPNCNIETL